VCVCERERESCAEKTSNAMNICTFNCTGYKNEENEAHQLVPSHDFPPARQSQQR
jgi:hypothetical protein